MESNNNNKTEKEVRRKRGRPSAACRQCDLDSLLKCLTDEEKALLSIKMIQEKTGLPSDVAKTLYSRLQPYKATAMVRVHSESKRVVFSPEKDNEILNPPVRKEHKSSWSSGHSARLSPELLEASSLRFFEEKDSASLRSDFRHYSLPMSSVHLSGSHRSFNLYPNKGDSEFNPQRPPVHWSKAGHDPPRPSVNWSAQQDDIPPRPSIYSSKPDDSNRLANTPIAPTSDGPPPRESRPKNVMSIEFLNNSPSPERTNYNL